jgi:hypothetical protein
MAKEEKEYSVLFSSISSFISLTPEGLELERETQVSQQIQPNPHAFSESSSLGLIEAGLGEG